MGYSRFSFQKRVCLLTGLIITSLLLLIGNLAYLQLIKYPYYKKLVQTQIERRIEIKPKRGTIYDRNKEVLAEELLGGSVFLRPRLVKDANLLSTKLAPLLSINEERLVEKLLGPQEITALYRNIDYPRFQQVKEIVRQYKITGVELMEERKRFYPNGRISSHILGFLNIDQEPLEGCEKTLNHYLGGRKGIVEGACDVQGNPIPTASHIIQPPENGLSVILTVDLNIQKIVEEELDKAFERLQPKSAIAIVMDPRNGEILALANRPTFDPNNQSRYPADYKRNKAVTDLYEVGSVIKPIVIAGALQEGIITPSSIFYCGGKIKVGNRTMSCVVHNKSGGGHGRVNPEKILEVSCNVGAAQVGLKMGARGLYEVLKSFCFDKTITDELFGARPGILPSLKDWDPVRTANVSFGQGISITPLHLISAFCAIVNGGILYKPHILKAIIQKDGTEVPVEPQILSYPLSPEVASKVRDMMAKVVESKEGTAYGYANIKGIEVGGKTGTAQKVINGQYTDEVVASFVGFFPVSDPRIVLLVLIDQPKINRWGATAAAPVFKQIAQRSLAYLGYNPQMTPITLDTLQAVASQRSPNLENKR